MTNEPEEDLRDMLRVRLTDPQPSRVGEFIVSNWPYDTDFIYNNYPRISVISQFENSRPFTLGGTDTWNPTRLQLDIWVKSDQVLNINGTGYEGFHQVIALSREITEAIRKNWVSDLANTGKVVLETAVNWYPAKYDYSFNLFRRTGDVTFAIHRKG